MAAIEYARWVERSTAEAGKEFRGMAEMPELAAALEAHVDAGVDPAPAVRSVYGQLWGGRSRSASGGSVVDMMKSA